MHEEVSGWRWGNTRAVVKSHKEVAKIPHSFLFLLYILSKETGPHVVTKWLQLAAPGVSSHNCDQKGKNVSLLLMAEEKVSDLPAKVPLCLINHSRVISPCLTSSG